MMNQNQPKLLPLYLILIGSCLLAVPGGISGVWLAAIIIGLIDKITAETKIFDLLFILTPLPAVIGFLLLLGYIWTAWRKRFVKWFWVISIIFNFLVTLVSGFFIVNYEIINALNCSYALFSSIFLLFPIWTLFVTIASAKYALFNRKDESLNLP